MIEPPEFPEKFDWGQVRSILYEWFFKLQRVQAFVEPGTIAAFTTSSLPAGWILTDGTDYADNKFPNLFKVLGTNGAAPGFMRVPTIAPDGYGTWMIKV